MPGVSSDLHMCTMIHVCPNSHKHVHLYTHTHARMCALAEKRGQREEKHFESDCSGPMMLSRRQWAEKATQSRFMAFWGGRSFYPNFFEPSAWQVAWISGFVAYFLCNKGMVFYLNANVPDMVTQEGVIST